jgi:U4/U6 small nuclear ribonucleoprotein PRP3
VPTSVPSDGKIHIRQATSFRDYESLPDVEWWDAALLPPESETRRFPTSDITESDFYIDKITHYVQHPRTVRNEYIDNIEKMVIPVYLIEKEKKKLRRMKRLDKEKDKQEKIKLGLIKAPPPKVKLSNYMKIMGKEALANPTVTEQKVKEIVEKRLEDHLKRNEHNKLTRDQREAKMKRKHERDIVNNECRIAVFKVESLTQPHLKFKVDKNA